MLILFTSLPEIRRNSVVDNLLVSSEGGSHFFQELHFQVLLDCLQVNPALYWIQTDSEHFIHTPFSPPELRTLQYQSQ